LATILREKRGGSDPASFSAWRCGLFRGRGQLWRGLRRRRSVGPTAYGWCCALPIAAGQRAGCARTRACSCTRSLSVRRSEALGRYGRHTREALCPFVWELKERARRIMESGEGLEITGTPWATASRAEGATSKVFNGGQACKPDSVRRVRRKAQAP
jgi:hypothetical protein